MNTTTDMSIIGLHKTRTLFFFTATATCVYFITRTLLLGYAGYSPIEKLTGLLLLLCEGFILLHAIGYARHAFQSGRLDKKIFPSFQDMSGLPTVAIVTAARHEPRAVLERTLGTLKAIDYPNKTSYLLDDSSEQSYMQEADALGKEFGITVFRREARHGAKAGIINDILSSLNAKYLVVFDADQNPMPDFLRKTLPIIESDPEIAFVQTPQIYTNTQENAIAEAAAMQQAIFYESICEGKSENNAMFCCGTNVVFRISALREVGSFDENSITEDFATSIKLHIAGYKSVYYNHAIAFGMAPESLPAYFKQQSRWAAGTVGVLRTIIKEFANNPHQLTPVQWWEYFLAGSYYLIGWVYFYLMLSPALFLIFNIPTFFLSPAIYIATFLPYFLLSMLVFYSSVSDRGYNFRQIYNGMIANFLCFPILMKATLLGLVGKRMTFTVTPKNGREVLPLGMMMPYVFMMLLNAVALAMVPHRLGAHPAAIIINGFWALYHLWLLTRIFSLNK